MDEIYEKIKSKKEEISGLNRETEDLEVLMNEEIQETEKKIKEAKENIGDLLESIKVLQSDYNRGEAQIVSQQYSIETARNSLKSHITRRNELEILNDNWENSIRSLEFYNFQLETQLQQAENFVLNLHTKIQSTSTQTKQDLINLESKNREIKKIITHKSRSPSPINRPPIAPKGPVMLSKLENINIINKPSVENSANVIIVSTDSAYINDKTVVFKDKSVKKNFEFKKVVKKSSFCNEVRVVCDNILAGKNCCVVSSAGESREKAFLDVVKTVSDFLLGKSVEINCVEIRNDQEINLLGQAWKTVVIGRELKAIMQGAYSKLSRGRNHLLLTLKIDSLYLQLLDLGKVSEDQDLSESLSLNASLFYLEELLMTLSKKTKNFLKSLLTQKLEYSLSSNYYLQCLFHFESSSDLPVLSLAARLESTFSRSTCKHPQNLRTLKILEKERLSNFHILRLIEKSQKDLSILKKELKNKDNAIQSLFKQSKTSPFLDRNFSLSPKASKPSRIPIPNYKKN